MNALDDVPRSVYRAVVVGVALYFAFLLVGIVTGEGAFVLAAHVLFGVIAIGTGAVLYARSATVGPLVVTAAAALVLGGVAQFVWLATGEGVFDLLASLLVFVGIGGYLLAIRASD